MNDNVTIYNSPEELAKNTSERLREAINKSKDKFFLSVSGGSTPEVFFSRLSRSPFKDTIQWDKLNMFWCDERCVPPENSDSNYGMTKRLLLDHISIMQKNIHRIKGEANHNEEAIRYAKEIEESLPLDENRFPVFDWILLGLGNDGHTASIFPDQNFIFVYSNFCGVSSHPETAQKRISLTTQVINNAKRISFIVTGKKKAKILSEIIKRFPRSKGYPASAIKPEDGILEWIVDKDAASFL